MSVGMMLSQRSHISSVTPYIKPLCATEGDDGAEDEDEPVDEDKPESEELKPLGPARLGPAAEDDEALVCLR